MKPHQVPEYADEVNNTIFWCGIREGSQTRKYISQVEMCIIIP